MGAVAHYLEARGVPTTSISLVRENTVLIRPPRALWVPFPLGRPFGAPHAPDFQRRVLRRALALLARISHTKRCVGLVKSVKLFCENDLTEFGVRADADRVYLGTA